MDSLCPRERGQDITHGGQGAETVSTQRAVIKQDSPVLAETSPGVIWIIWGAFGVRNVGSCRPGIRIQAHCPLRQPAETLTGSAPTRRLCTLLSERCRQGGDSARALGTAPEVAPRGPRSTLTAASSGASRGQMGGQGSSRVPRPCVLPAQGRQAASRCPSSALCLSLSVSGQPSPAQEKGRSPRPQGASDCSSPEHSPSLPDTH